MEDTIVKTVLTRGKPDSLTISLRLLRLILSAVLVFAVTNEPAVTGYWQITLSSLAIYTLITGAIGRDPLFAYFRQKNKPLSDNALDIIAQAECFSIGVICFVAGMFIHFTNSVVFMLLPFLGIYPIVLCMMKHDLLGFLLKSYRR